MNRTTTLVGLVAGLAGAGITYTLKSKDTTHGEEVSPSFEPNSNILTPIVRITPGLGNKYETAIKKSKELAKRFKQEIGTPGLVVGVSVDGQIIWEEGFGFANLETSTPCLADTAMRIASISKPITMALLAKLIEAKKVDLNKSVYEYVPDFPKKVVDGEEVDITIRQLASHTGGVRHYRKKGQKDQKDYCEKEFYLKEKFDSIAKSLELFKDDELLFKPGTSFEYTTHGYTLLSAVIEKAGEKPFTEQIQNFFQAMNLKNTNLDKVQKIIYGRASYYTNKHGRVLNAELADTSYKWAGGGFISTVGDLLKFGNAMLYCYQQTEMDKPGYLKKETMMEMWTPVKNTKMKWGQNSGYGLGWTIVPKVDDIGGVAGQKFSVGHAGGAVGASSVLVIIPKESTEKNVDDNNNKILAATPQGVTVAVLVNLEDISCRTLAYNIAEEFYNV